MIATGAGSRIFPPGPCRLSRGLPRAAALLALALALSGCGGDPPSGGPPPDPAPEASTLPAPAGDGADLTGIWVARLEHGGRSREIAMEVIPAEGGGLAARLTIPALEIRSLPAGPVKVEGDRVVLGPITLRKEAGGALLRGVMPPALIPVHEIEVAFRRASALPLPGPGEPRLPEPEVAWTFRTDGPIWGGVTLSGGRLFTGSDDGNVYALEAESGREIWRAATGGAVRARPVVDGDFIVVPSDDGRLYRLEAATGEVAWSRELGPPVRRRSPGEEGFRYDLKAPSVAISGGVVYAAHPGGELFSLEADSGSKLWSHAAGDIVTASPAAGRERVYMGSFDGMITALDAATGEVAWERNTGAPVTSSPALHGDRIIAGSRSYDLMALDAESGSREWTYYCWFSWVESSPVIRDGVIYVGSSDAQLLHAVDAASGGPLWTFDTGGSAWGRPAVTEDAVFIGSVGVSGYIIDHRGGFVAVDRESGEGLWRLEAPAPGGAAMWGFASAPAAGPRRVYAGGLDGKVYAFSLNPPPGG